MHDPRMIDLPRRLASCASAIEEICIGMDGDAAAKRPAPGAWSVREHLSHLQGEDRYGYVDGIREILFEGVRELDVEQGITHYTADRRQIAFPALVSAVAGQYRAIADIASRMTEEELEARIGIDVLRDTPFGAQPTLREWLFALSEWHVPDHISQISATRAGLGA